MDTSLRIAVVGAGASGLTAAHTLKKLGYENVVVFERSERVGGKVNTVEHEGRSYELGAYVVTEAYDTVLEMAGEYRLELREAPPRFVIDLDSGKIRDFGDYLRSRYGLFSSLVAVARYWWLTGRHKRIYEPGLAGASASLHPRFDEYAADHEILPVAHLFRPVYTSLGYGYYERIPALYVLKFLDRNKVVIVLKSAVGISQSWPRIFAGGFQGLWEAVAADLDVRLKHEVTAVRREEVDGAPRVFVTAADQEREFDRVVFAAPLDIARWIMDVDAEEADLFGRIRHMRYYATLFFAEGLPSFQTTYLEQHQTPDTLGRTLLISHPYADGALRLAYHFGPDGDSSQQITANLRADVERMGGTFKGVYDQRNWKYFPHVNPEDLADGFFERVDALQGQRGTTYVGGLLNFETVEDSAALAKAMIQRQFG